MKKVSHDLLFLSTLMVLQFICLYLISAWTRQAWEQHGVEVAAEQAAMRDTVIYECPTVTFSTAVTAGSAYENSVWVDGRLLPRSRYIRLVVRSGP